jgi:AraC-like DNA-binding protein
MAHAAPDAVHFRRAVAASLVLGSCADMQTVRTDESGVTAARDVLYRPDEMRFDQGLSDAILGVPTRTLARDARCRLLGSRVGLRGTTRTKQVARSIDELIVIDARQPYEIAFDRHRAPAIDFVYLPSDWLRTLAADVGSAPESGVSLRTDLRVVDGRLRAIGRAYLAAATEPIAGRLTLETARHLLGIGLLTRRGAGFRRRGTRSRVLPLLTLRRIDDFVHAHLNEDFGLDALAGIARQSVHHFIRSFRLTTGRTPHQYVLRRRVERAAELLATTRTPLAAVAAETGFSSQTHLTHAFSRAYGVPPGRYRQSTMAATSKH